jgi:hypothetical protein
MLSAVSVPDSSATASVATVDGVPPPPHATSITLAAISVRTNPRLESILMQIPSGLLKVMLDDPRVPHAADGSESSSFDFGARLAAKTAAPETRGEHL